MMPCLRCRSSAALFLLGLVLINLLRSTGAQLGVCYGMNGDALPSKQETVTLYRQYGIQKMRLYDPNRGALEALAGSNIEVMLGVVHVDFQKIASSQEYADSWVQNNALIHDKVNFKYIVIGNEVKPENEHAQYLLPAMQNMLAALSRFGLSDQIKISTAVDTGVLGESYPPSKGSFKSAYRSFLDPIIQFLVNNNYPLLLNMYTYFSYVSNTRDISLDYALVTGNANVVPDGSLQYQNLFDATLDAVYSALERADGGSLQVVVSETGWPSDGGTAASVENARTYVTNIIQHVKKGTPKRPGSPVETYIFAMYDENQKSPDYEKFWGLFLADGRPKYEFNFT